ncbi:MAG: peptidylprolyl isomerase [Puniceicoccales bacterium]|jgi:peptidyl-prolyl cis-trans isomerase D|nr:peptidylprolyl isomerase [Puniceicoccales bacterium]
MISFLQNIIQKHHKWLFSILLFVIIVSFVFTIGASPGIGIGRKHSKKDLFFGYDLRSERDRNALFQETWLSTAFDKTPIFFEVQLQNLALARAIELHYAKELHIPEPSEQQLRGRIRLMPLFFSEETKKFDITTYEKVLQDLLKNPQITPAVIQKVLSDDWKITLVREALGRQGYAFSSQARSTLTKAETQYTFDILSLSIPTKEEIPFSEEDIRAYVDQHSERYLEPESYRLSLIEFNPERYHRFISVATKEVLKKFYLEHRKDFESLQEGSDELKQAIIGAYEHSQLLAIATQKASDFAYQVYEKELASDSDAFRELLTNSEAQWEDLPLFVPGRSFRDERLSAEDLAIVTTLDEEHAFSDPIALKNGHIAILLLKETIPPHPSDFETIRDVALSDLRQERHTEMFRTRCEEISKVLLPLQNDQNSFQERAQELGLSRKTCPQLKPKDAHGQLSQPVLQALLSLAEGQCSQDIFQGDHCEWIWLHTKTADTSAITEENIQKALDLLERHSAQNRTESFFMENIENFSKKHHR